MMAIDTFMAKGHSTVRTCRTLSLLPTTQATGQGPAEVRASPWSGKCSARPGTSRILPQGMQGPTHSEQPICCVAPHQPSTVWKAPLYKPRTSAESCNDQTPPATPVERQPPKLTPENLHCDFFRTCHPFYPYSLSFIPVEYSHSCMCAMQCLRHISGPGSFFLTYGPPPRTLRSPPPPKVPTTALAPHRDTAQRAACVLAQRVQLPGFARHHEKLRR